MLMKLSKKPRDRQIMYSRILNPLDKIQVLRKKILLKSMEKEGLNMRLKRDFVKEGTYGAQIRTKLIKVKFLPKMKRLIPQNIKDLGKSLMSKYGVTEQTLKYNKPKAVESLLSKKQTPPALRDVPKTLSELKRNDETTQSLEKKLSDLELERTNKLIENKGKGRFDDRLKDEIDEVKRKIYKRENELATRRNAELEGSI